MRRALPWLLALWPLANASADPLPIRITVAPVIAQAPSDVHLKVVIERDAENRHLIVAIDGDRFTRESVEQVDGAQRQRVWDFWWQKVPCGVYRVAAVVVRSNGKQELVAKTVTLHGPPCVFDDAASEVE